MAGSAGEFASHVGLGDAHDRVSMTSRRRVVMAAVCLATAGYLVWLVVAHLSQIDRAVLRFQGAQARWLVAAVGLEVVSQACGVVVQHRLLRRAGSSMGFAATSRLVLAQNAIGLALPGGPAFASAFSYRHIRRRGTNASAAAWVVAATNVVGMLALGTFGAVTATGTSWLSLLVALMLAGALVILVLLARSPWRLRTPMIACLSLVDRTWQRNRPRASGPAKRVDGRLARISTVRLGWRDWLVIVAFALSAVAADCAVWVCASHAIIALPARCVRSSLSARVAAQCASFHAPTISGLLVAYSAGQAALSVPLLPGGLGLVESFMTATLTATKVRAIPALSAVLLYRLISGWGIVIIGATIWIATKRRRRSEPVALSNTT